VPPYWLLAQIGPQPDPRFALQSSLNWIRAWAFEIEMSHGPMGECVSPRVRAIVKMGVVFRSSVSDQ